MPPLSLNCHGHQRPQGTRNQQTAGQMSRSRPVALALPSHVTKSHSVSREIRSVRPLCTSQVYPVSHFHFPPGEHVRLAWSCADQFRSRRVASHNEELLRTLPQQSSLPLVQRVQVVLDFAVVFRSHTIACNCSIRFISSTNSSSQSFNVARLCVFRRSHNSRRCLQELFHVRGKPSQLWRRGNIFFYNCLHCPLAVLFVVGAHTLEGFPSVPTKIQDYLARRLALGLHLLVVSSRVPEGC